MTAPTGSAGGWAKPLRAELRLGRLAGVLVVVHWSVLAIIVLFSWSLAAVSFPSFAPGYPRWAYWLTAATAAVVLLCCLVVHELAHAILARRAGVEVEELTLWLFGGVTRFRSELPTAGAEFRTAAVGPASSLVLAAVAAGVAEALDALGASALLVAAAWWLAATNGIIGLFNLLPGAPLDGGRVLHAYLWHRHGDRARASVAATQAGQAVGLGIAVLGVGEFLATNGGVSGIWLACLGWLLNLAARTEHSSQVLHQVLAGVRVGDVMTPDPDTAPSWLTIEAFVEQHALRRQHSAYPVCNLDGTAEGLVTLGQLGGVVTSARGTTRIRDVATPLRRVPTATPEEELVRLLERMSVGARGRALVLQSGRVVGILTRSDISRMVELRTLAGADAEAARLREAAPEPAARQGINATGHRAR